MIKNINLYSCECGGRYTLTNFKSHLKTEKHKNYLNNLKKNNETKIIVDFNFKTYSSSDRTFNNSFSSESSINSSVV
jgi:hypothetical protein